jgi:hypothetical protein
MPAKLLDPDAMNPANAKAATNNFLISAPSME